ncbi:hypothetical protein AVEN_101877-1 [Araneus ventricosus]|uniref:Uncharacterized protein n=1 Tax=Araneus ventricosus TaxID=182803 RepID=A0A4Y2D883_ARAVE|nr:hypothetical protein AVEN_101877-1 [Araneus ventricosus]
MTRYQAIDTPGTNIANIRPRGRHARPTRGDFAVHEKQEANRVVTASHGEFLACRREQEAKKRKVEAEGEGKPEGRPDQKASLYVKALKSAPNAPSLVKTLRTAFPMMQNSEIAKDLTPLSLDPVLSGRWKRDSDHQNQEKYFIR